VLGTGLLTEAETLRVVRRLLKPDMLREFGIATLSADNPAYNPAGYHTGSVWVHDTAIVLHGLVRTGFEREARLVSDALMRLSSAVHHRFPELVAGDAVGSRPVPYPASCRPQAWSAASAAVLAAARDGRQMPSTKDRATAAGS
jgi:glycogen debranching enzyme